MTHLFSLRSLAPADWWMYSRQATSHIQCMAIYTVIRTADRSGFDVVITGAGGAHQTTLGFASKDEANAWIARAARLTKPWMPRRGFGGGRHL